MGGIIISRLEVSRRASGITSRADSRRASRRLIGWLDSESGGGKHTTRAQINTGQIPVDSVTGLGVLELEDVLLPGVEGELNRDATAVRVGAPILRVDATAAAEDQHRADVVGHGPGIDVLLEVIDDRDTTAALAGHYIMGKSRGNGGKEGSKAESLSEHHFESRTM